MISEQEMGPPPDLQRRISSLERGIEVAAIERGSTGALVAERLKAALQPDQDIVSPWHPITSELQLKLLGKLGEELTEAATAIFRCIIQGVDEREPVTGKLNREWLEDELADAWANIALVEEHYKLNNARMRIRAARKMAALRRWHQGGGLTDGK